MSVNKMDPDTKPQFNYLVCLDIVVLACILVVAGRPDGLAITLSAVIIAAAAVFYRCSVGVKSYMAGKPRAPDAGARKAGRPPEPAIETPAVESSADDSASRRSWLRE